MKMLKKIIKEKKKLLLIIVSVVIVVFLVIFILFKEDGLISVLTTSDNVQFKNEYEKLNEKLTEDGKLYPEVTIPSNNVMRYTDMDEILRIFQNEGNGVIYLGYATCLYCRSAIEVLLNTAANIEINKIYYLDVEDARKNDKEKYNKLKNLLGEEFYDEDNKTKDLYIPLVLFVVDGKVVSYQKGTLFSQTSPYDELDKYQIMALEEIYGYGIRDVLEGMKN